MFSSYSRVHPPAVCCRESLREARTRRTCCRPPARQPTLIIKCVTSHKALVLAFTVKMEMHTPFNTAIPPWDVYLKEVPAWRCTKIPLWGYSCRHYLLNQVWERLKCSPAEEWPEKFGCAHPMYCYRAWTWKEDWNIFGRGWGVGKAGWRGGCI